MQIHWFHHLYVFVTLSYSYCCVFLTDGCSRERAIAALMAEPGFQLNSIEFLLGDSETGAASDEETFSLSDCKSCSEFRAFFSSLKCWTLPAHAQRTLTVPVPSR